MKLVLQTNWDDSPSGKNTPSRFFSGRSKETQLLSSILLNKKSGSILVSAPRGTGKTDLVYKALEEAKKENNKLITIVFNANHLSKDIKDVDSNLAILRNLIRRTYSECKNIKDVSTPISLLYNQATASSYEESSTLILESSKETTDLKKDISKTEVSVGLNKKFITQEFQRLYPYILVSTSVLSIDNWIKLGLATLILVLGVSSDIYIKRSSINKVSNTKSNKDGDIARAQLAYKRDGSVGNLEHGLKDLLTDLETKGYKVAFVIDELDKLPGDPKQVLNAVASFKGFFNHSDALFIFISDETVFSFISEARKTRAIESTLFNQRIFITKPTAEDIREYLTKIIYSKPSEVVEDFENYVTYQAQMDFYYVPDVLRDLITGYEGKRPFIEWDETHISTEIQRVITKQKVINALLKDGKYLYTQASNKSKNDSLIKSAYELANTEGTFNIPVNSTELDSDKKTIDQFKVDLARYLTFSGIYTQTITEDNGIQVYQFTNTSLAGDPVTDLKTPLEFEQDLINRFNEFNNFVLNLFNFKSLIKAEQVKNNVDDQMINELSQQTGFEINIYSNIRKIIEEELRQYPLSHLRGQEELRKYGEDLRNAQANIVRNNTLTFLKIAYEDIGIPVWTLNDTPGLPQIIPSITSFINENGVQNIVLRDDKKNQYAIILLNNGNSLVTSEAAVEDLRNNRNIFVLEMFPIKLSTPDTNEQRLKTVSVENFEITPKKVKESLKGFGGLE